MCLLPLKNGLDNTLHFIMLNYLTLAHALVTTSASRLQLNEGTRRGDRRHLV